MLAKRESGKQFLQRICSHYKSEDGHGEILIFFCPSNRQNKNARLLPTLFTLFGGSHVDNQNKAYLESFYREAFYFMARGSKTGTDYKFNLFRTKGLFRLSFCAL